MSFIADKQTLEDLNLLGKYKQQSIFSLFNKVNTAGGEQLLHAMFQTPLTDPVAINRRSAIFRYFQHQQLSFPINNEQFSLMENYLSGSSGKSYPAVLMSLAKKKLLGTVVRDEEYQNIQTGLQQTIAVLNTCKTFISELEEKKQQHPFYDELLAVKNILNHPRLAWLAAEQAGPPSLPKKKSSGVRSPAKAYASFGLTNGDGYLLPAGCVYSSSQPGASAGLWLCTGAAQGKQRPNRNGIKAPKH